MYEIHFHNTWPCPWGLREKQSERWWLLDLGQKNRKDGRAIWEPRDPGKRRVWRRSGILFWTYSSHRYSRPHPTHRSCSSTATWASVGKNFQVTMSFPALNHFYFSVLETLPPLQGLFQTKLFQKGWLLPHVAGLETWKPTIGRGWFFFFSIKCECFRRASILLFVCSSLLPWSQPHICVTYFGPIAFWVCDTWSSQVTALVSLA